MLCLKIKCTKFDFRWGFAPDPAGGAQDAPPHLLDGFTSMVPTVRGN